MINFFYGQESFSVKEAVKKKTADFLKLKPGLLVEKIDLDKEEGIKPLKDAVETRSIFNENKLIVANGLFANSQTRKDALETLKEYQKEPEKNLSFLFYECSSGLELNKKDKNLFNFLSQNAPKSAEILPLKNTALEKWCIEEFAKGKIKIQTPVVKKFLALVSYSHEWAKNEVAKLTAYKNFAGQNTNKEIKEADLDKIVTPELAFNNFDLTDAIASKNHRKAILLLDQYLSENGDPNAILGLIIFQFRALLRVKSLIKKNVPTNRIAGLTKLHPFVAAKASSQAKIFDQEELKKIYQHLHSLDLEFKNGQTEILSSLFCLLLEMGVK
ncbi:MAG TPA: DNA polymerase III subunit delta [Candidatus Paceibacterota bacterium]